MRTSQLAALVLYALMLSVCTAESFSPETAQPFVVRDPDIIVTFASSVGKRLMVAQASRAWRGPLIRAHMCINGSEAHAARLSERHMGLNESYEFFPDEGTGFLGEAWHGQYAGDSRATMAPILAYRYEAHGRGRACPACLWLLVG